MEGWKDTTVRRPLRRVLGASTSGTGALGKSMQRQGVASAARRCGYRHAIPTPHLSAELHRGFVLLCQVCSSVCELGWLHSAPATRQGSDRPSPGKVKWNSAFQPATLLFIAVVLFIFSQVVNYVLHLPGFLKRIIDSKGRIVKSLWRVVCVAVWQPWKLEEAIENQRTRKAGDRTPLRCPVWWLQMFVGTEQFPKAGSGWYNTIPGGRRQGGACIPFPKQANDSLKNYM